MSYVEEIDRLTEQLAQVTAHRDGLRIVAAHEQVRRETAEAQRDRALAERDRARDLAQHLEEDSAGLTPEYASRVESGGGLIFRTLEEAREDQARNDERRRLGGPWVDCPPPSPSAGVEIRYVTEWKPVASS